MDRIRTARLVVLWKRARPTSTIALTFARWLTPMFFCTSNTACSLPCPAVLLQPVNIVVASSTDPAAYLTLLITDVSTRVLWRDVGLNGQPDSCNCQALRVIDRPVGVHEHAAFLYWGLAALTARAAIRAGGRPS